MRTLLCHGLLLSLIFASVEGAADLMVDGFPHDTEVVSHQDEFGHSQEAHEDGTSGSDVNDDHCKHCCHAHSAGITSQFDTLSKPAWVREPIVERSSYLLNLAQAPPTPPPNA